MAGGTPSSSSSSSSSPSSSVDVRGGSPGPSDSRGPAVNSSEEGGEGKEGQRLRLRRRAGDHERLGVLRQSLLVLLLVKMQAKASPVHLLTTPQTAHNHDHEGQEQGQEHLKWVLQRLEAFLASPAACTVDAASPASTGGPVPVEEGLGEDDEGLEALTVSEDDEGLEALTVSELKDQLRSMGLPLSGRYLTTNPPSACLPCR